MEKRGVIASAPVLFMAVLGLTGCWDESSKQIGSTYSITTLLLDPGSCVTEPVDPANPDPATDPVDCKTVYVATAGGGILKSEDGGGSWARKNGGLIEWNISKLAMDPKDPMTLYAGTENQGLFRTDDGGEFWFNPSTSPDTIKSITSIAVDPHPYCSPSPCIYVGSQESGVWVSENEGQSWTQMNNGLPETTVTALAVFSYNKFPSDLYAGTEGGHLYKFNFNPTVKKWEEALPGLSEKTVASPLVIAVNPLAPAGSEIYVGTSGGEGQTLGGTFRSVDSGRTWTVVNIPNAQNFTVRELTFCLQVEPQCPPTLPVSDTDSGTATDGTATTLSDTSKSWAPAQWFGATVTITTGVGAGQSRTVVSNTGTVLRFDPASPWTPPPVAGSAYTITANDAIRDKDAIYAGVYGLSKIYFTQTGFWANIDTGLIQAGNNTTSLAIDALRHTTLYAGTLSGFVIKSRDAGATWKRIDLNF